MSYIGRKPTVGNFQICDAISVVNGQAAYTMQVGSVNVLPETANHMIVSLNGTIQKPNSSFTVSGSTITFAANLVTGDVINFIQILGDVLDLGVPSDGTVTSAKIANDAVTLAKMAPGTDGNIISYDASGNPVAVATGNDGQVLTSAGAGAIPTFETLPVGGITNAQQWRITSGFSFSSLVDISSNWEEVDSSGYARIGDALTQSSGIFTFPTTGYWLITSQANYRGNVGNRGVGFNMLVTTNNSSYGIVASAEVSNSDFGGTNNTTFHAGAISALIDVTNTTNVKFKLTTQATGNSGDAQTCDGDTDRTYTGFSAVRLGDT